jgi:YD repeat-containing protein
MLNFKTKSWLPFLLLCISVMGYSQTQPKLPDFAMQTPQAAALSKYSEYPVGSFTGVPSINVPLYTIECGDISFPIGLNYHAGGFKVTEEASWVGLGWTLTANGAITRTVNGYEDFGNYTVGPSNYYHNNNGVKIVDIIGSFPCPYTQTPFFTCDNGFYPDDEKVPSYSNGGNAISMVDGKIVDYRNLVGGSSFDWEPDVYSINIMGLNGKFVLDQDKNVYFLDRQDIEVKRLDSGGWMARSNDGFQYYFNFKETTRSSYDVNEQNGSWQITKIVSPTKRELNFFYEEDTKPSYQINYSESTSNNQTYTETVTNYVYLKRIEFDNGYVVFNKDVNLREDLKNGSQLKTIQIYNNANILIKEFELGTSYFNTNDPTRGFLNRPTVPISNYSVSDEDYTYYQKRLKLNKVIERNGTLSKSTLFNYSTLNLPNKDSYSQDHWGYYNGQDNKRLIPSVEGVFPFTQLTSNRIGGGIESCRYPIIDSYFYYNVGGGFANRKANPATMTANILQEIVYPTGGKTSFEFEANDCIPYGKDAEEYQYFSQTITVNSNGTAPDVATGTTELITKDPNGIVPDVVDSTTESIIKNPSSSKPDLLTYTSNIPANLGIYASYFIFEMNGATPLTLPINIEASLEDYYYGRDKLLFSKLPFDATKPIIYSEGIDSKNLVGPLTLSINIPDIANYQLAKITFKCKLKQNNFSKKYVGGLRVAKINHTDGIDIKNDIIKKYTYTNDKINQGLQPTTSSGIIKSPIKYWTQYLGNTNDYCNSKIIFSSTIKNGLTLSQYSHIGYGQVTEYMGNTGEFGSTQYIYYNLPNLTSLEDTAPLGVPYSINQGFDGKLKSKINFDSGSQAVQYEYYDYEKLSEKVIKSIAQRPRTTSGSLVSSWSGNNAFWYYPIFSRWEPMVSSSKGVYNASTNSYTETTTAYEFNTENLLPSKITTFDSNTNKLITKNYYATDVTSANYTTVLGEPLSITEYNNVNQLKRNKDNTGGTGDFKTAQPIQVEIYKNTDLLSRQRTLFSTFGNLNLPSSLKTAKTTNALENRIQYNKYDDKGNPLELQLTGGTTVAYIWGYNKTLPVAKIENATYAQVEALMGGAGFAVTDGLTATQETTLRTGLPNAMITTYTHIPLVGVSTITDPKGDKITYEYDGFNRLKSVKDKNGNKLSENEYHYKTP